MTEADRDLSTLHPVFRLPLEAWLERAQGEAQHVRLFVTEARRTLGRQKHLYASGRTRDGPIVTNTLDSRHRWGLAADLAMQRPTGELVWAEDSWAWLYKVAPPARFGLRSLDPFEWVHLEFRYSDEAISEADELGLTQS